MKTIAVDFDGVIHTYSKGWHDGSTYDEPVTGSFDGLLKLMEDCAVYIFSTRSPEQIQNWLAENQFPLPTQIVREMGFWNTRGVLGISQLKLPAVSYIDDRAVLFTTWKNVLQPAKAEKDKK